MPADTADETIAVSGACRAMFERFMHPATGPGEGGLLFQAGMALGQGADALLAVSALAIAAALAVLLWRAGSALPTPSAFAALAVGMGSTGMLHVLRVVWSGSTPSGLESATKAIAAMASTTAALLFLPAVPKLIAVLQTAAHSRRREALLKKAHKDLRSLYACLQRGEELRSKLFANVSHELRTPLTLVASPVERLLLRPDLPDAARRDLRTIRRNAMLLNKHVSDLLSVAKKQSGELRVGYAEVDLARLVREVCAHFDSLAEERRVTFEVRTGPPLVVEVDPAKLERVILNLLFNAFKFTPEGGVLRCELRREPEAEQVRIEVADSGPGVPEDAREVVFERFRQLDLGASPALGGTGLGLSISRDFIELHRGSLYLEHAPEGGALFVIELPPRAPPGALVHAAPEGEAREAAVIAELAAAALANDLTMKGMKDGPTSGMQEEEIDDMSGSETERERPRVLVVEDNRDLNRFLCRCLGTEFDVLTAKNGADGLAIALRGQLDLVLTDVMMPVMSGEQLITELKAREDLYDIPIVVLTARDDDQLRVKLLKQGVQDFITKPFLTDEVIARVRNLVAAKRAADVLSREMNRKRMDLETMALEVARGRRELQTALDQMQVARDIAERASSVKSNFLRMMSHELRTPIAAMQLQLRLLEKQGADRLEPKQKEYLERISRSAQRLLDLVNTVLEYARIESGRFEARVKTFSLEQVLRESVEEFRTHAQQKGIELTLAPMDPMPLLSSDPQVVRLIAVNLIGNAVKHTEQGQVSVGGFYDGDMQVLWVKDTGPGIAKEHQMEVFEPFQRFEDIRQLQGAGSGLGLAIVRDMVRAVHGEITLESDVGKGATFQVSLPPLKEGGKEQRTGGAASA